MFLIVVIENLVHLGSFCFKSLFLPVFQRSVHVTVKCIRTVKNKRAIELLQGVLESWTIVQTMKSKQTEIGFLL